MTDRLTKFNEETGKYEYKERAKTQEEFNAQRKAVIQRLGEFEDKQEPALWQEANTRRSSSQFVCAFCRGLVYYIQPTRDRTWKKHCPYKYCPWCGSEMKGDNNEQRR